MNGEKTTAATDPVGTGQADSRCARWRVVARSSVAAATASAVLGAGVLTGCGGPDDTTAPARATVSASDVLARQGG